MNEIYQLMPKMVAALGAIEESHKHPQGWVYRGKADFLNALQPVLVAHGCTLVPEVLEDQLQPIQVENTNKTKSAMYTRVKLAVNVFAPDGSFVRAVAVGDGQDYEDSAATNAFDRAMRTALEWLFCVPTKRKPVAAANTAKAQRETASTQTAARPVANVEMAGTPVQAKATVTSPATAKPRQHKACPAAIQPDDWDARCALVDEFTEVTATWDALTIRKFVMAELQLESLSVPDDLYCEVATLKALVNAAREYAVPPPSAHTEEETEAEKERKFNVYANKKGLSSRVYSIREKYRNAQTKLVDWDGAYKAIDSLSAQQRQVA